MSSHREGFLGVVIVECDSPLEAFSKVKEIAPEQLAKSCAINHYIGDGIEAKYLNRLILNPEINW
jgi:hypothetical protein